MCQAVVRTNDGHSRADTALSGGAEVVRAPGEQVVAGWKLTIDLTPRGYWFSIEDTTDPCGFRYISNEQGLIFTAEPLR